MLHVHVFLAALLSACDMAQAGADEHQRGIAVGEGPYDAGSPPDLTVQTLNDIVGTDFQPMLREKVHIGQGFLALLQS